jgi:hypothetical protein
VSEGREHGADRKAWVVHLATPVDGRSVVAPTFDRVWMVPAKGCQVSKQTWRIDPSP